MSQLTAPGRRVLLALVALLGSGPLWFVVVLYLGLEDMGMRSHPVLGMVAWLLLAVMATAAVVLSVEAVRAVLRLLNRRGHF